MKVLIGHFREVTKMMERSNSEDSKSIPNENIHVTNGNGRMQ